ncbi:MAG: FAD-binding protein [Actinomycetota bacterium]|nr:FAD-binding protein [Actinomycetota bacterium]
MTIDVTPLVQALGDDRVLVEPDRMAGYRWDRAGDPDAGTPLAVVRAESTSDVQVAVRFAANHAIAVVPRGAGSGLSGGASARDGCIVVSTERMRELHIDPATRTAVVQPGLFTAEVKAAAAAYGLWYPPDPSSYEICSIGGNVATNAGGLCCVKYGVTSDYVLGLSVVLANGTAVTLGGPRLKDVAGLSLTKLFVGSEGTLGIVTEIVLRLIPAQEPLSTIVATFASLDDSTQAVLDITRQLRPAMLEFMDQTTITAVDDLTRMGLNRDAKAMLVIQSDQPGQYASVECAKIAQVCRENRASEIVSTDDPTEGEAFVVARRMAIPAVEKKGPLLLEDVGVPVPQLGALVRGIDRLADQHGVTIAVIAHAGDGNTHPLIVCDRSDAELAARAQLAYGDVMGLAIALGGTITGEHGVGRIKKPWLADYLGPAALALNQRVKQALDPLGIMNPGTIL